MPPEITIIYSDSAITVENEVNELLKRGYEILNTHAAIVSGYIEFVVYMIKK